MQKELVQGAEIKLVGISVITSNQNEQNPATAKIAATIQKYFSQGFAAKVLHHKAPGTYYSCYTNYPENFDIATGNYTYFFGEEVLSFDDVAQGLETLLIPTQRYNKFTSESGQMPKICMDLWHKIWSMSDQELGATRAFIADYELYDARAVDPLNTTLDIFVGIK